MFLNAPETLAFVTVNAPALRHFIAMRGRRAETTIRRLALQVPSIMQREAPFLFADHPLIDLPDGGQFAVMPYRKV